MGRKSKNKTPTGNKKNITNDVPKKVKRRTNELLSALEKLLKLCTTVSTPTSPLNIWENYLDIQNILETIKRLESDIKPKWDNRDSAALTTFLEWMKTNGGIFKNINISEFPGYELGLQTEIERKEGDLVIAVPRDLMMTIESAKSSALGSLISQDTLLQHMPNVTIALYLILEKHKPDSFWKPYISVLPTRFSTVLYFSSEDFKELKGSPTYESALKQYKNIARQYAYFKKMFLTSNSEVAEQFKSIFTFEEYRWAVSVVMTRQNSVPASDGSEMINALIPLWDMCNHTNGKVSTDFNTELNRSECLALRDFKAGEQIFIFYGLRTNSDLFLHNGFVYFENEHDEYWLKLGVGKSDPLKDQRLALLDRLGLPLQGEFCLHPGAEPIDSQLLAFARIFNMNEEHIKHWLESISCHDLEYLDCILDTELDTRSWSFLETRMKLLLASYPTSLAADLELLDNNNELSPCKQLAIKMRVSEKRLLQGALSYAEQRLRQK